MQLSEKGLRLIQSFEGYKDHAYLDTGGVPTIGFGTIRYPNAIKVKMGDVCTAQEAQGWLLNDVKWAVSIINHLHWEVPLNQSQFDALVSFHYNTGALPKSTLYKKASINPNDETIYKYTIEHSADSCEFLKWVRDNGKIIQGLINRRQVEADLYAGK